VVMETNYNLFGSMGHLKWDFDFEVFEVLCGIIGAIIVVGVGLHLQRGARTKESEAVVDILTHSAEELANSAKELHGRQPVGAKD
jgi:hypothetical protein